MIIERIRKILAGISIATYLIVYAAPMGMCISSVPKMNASVQKPALRGSASPAIYKLEGDFPISKRNPKITLSLRDSDVKQVLRMLADKAGMNIIFHQSVDQKDMPINLMGTQSAMTSQSSSTSTSSSDQKPEIRKVTMDLVNVPLNEAFKMVMQVTGLTYFVESNTIVVAAANTAQQTLNLSKQNLMIIPIKYIDSTMMADFLNKNIFTINKPGLSNAQIAVTNPGRNEVLIFGTKNDYLMARKIVMQFDKKPLESNFTVNHTTPKEMANLVCTSFFKTYTSTSAKAVMQQSTSTQQNQSFTPGLGTSGSSSGSSGSSSGSATGGASSTDSGSGSSGSSGLSSSSSSSSSDSLSDTVEAGLSLGQGVVACRYNNDVNTGNLSSFHTPNLQVTYFPQRGNIQVIGGSAQQHELIRNFIADNDKKQPQAYLEVSIIELTESGSKTFNNTWNIYSSFFSATFDPATGTTATPSGYPTILAGDTDGTTMNRFNGNGVVSYAINYIIKNGKGRILANPRIIITNGKTSVIDLTSDYVAKVDTTVNTTNGSTVTTYDYTINNDSGIKVELLPFISPDGYVTMNIKPDYSTVYDKIYNPSNPNAIAATLLQRRNLDLKHVRIKDGETLVIGGMMREDETKTVYKMPILGDMPGVGMFFRGSKAEKEKHELVIMLTPRIIKDTDEIVKTPYTPNMAL